MPWSCCLLYTSTVFQCDPLLSGAIAYNILTDRKDIIKPIGFHRESTALNDTDMKYLLLYLEETYGLTNEKKIDKPVGFFQKMCIRDRLISLTITWATLPASISAMSCFHAGRSKLPPLQPSSV